MSTKKSNTMKNLEKITGTSVSFRELIWSIRMGENLSQTAFAKTLKISKSHLNDIEKGRKAVSPERAAKFAKILGYSRKHFVQMALQDIVDGAGLRLKVQVSA